MATVKSYTDIEQSRKLAEILPLESADGFWEYHNRWRSEGDEWEGYEDYPRAEPYLEYTRMENEWKEDKSDIPCWSLAALYNALPYTSLHKDERNNHLCLTRVGINTFKTIGHCAINACYKMILKLHELNLL